MVFHITGNVGPLARELETFCITSMPAIAIIRQFPQGFLTMIEEEVTDIYTNM